MVVTAIGLFVVALVLVIIGISWVYDINKGVGPTAEFATVDSLNPSRTYTFLRISGRPVAWFVTILDFILAAGAVAGAIAVLVINA